MIEALGNKAFLDPAKFVEVISFDARQLANCGIPGQFNVPIFLFQQGYLTLERNFSDKVFLDYPNSGTADWIANLYKEDLKGERGLEYLDGDEALIRLFKDESYSEIIKRLNDVLSAMKFDESVPITLEYALGVVLNAFRVLGLKPEVFKSTNHQVTDFLIRVISDRWTFAVFLDEGKSDSFNAFKAKFKLTKMRSRGVKNVKALLVFSKAEKRIVRMEIVDCVIFSPRSLLGLCLNPTQIGPRVFPDYYKDFLPQNFFRLKG